MRTQWIRRDVRATTGNLLAAALLAAAFPASSLAGETSDTRGWMIGLGASSSHIDAVDETAGAPAGAVFIDDSGGGGMLQVGYGFTPAFALRLHLNGAQHETSDPGTEFWLNSVAVEGVFLFRDPSPFRPYVFGGLGGFTTQSRRDTFDFEATGPGVTAGAGFVYFVGDRFALDFGLRGDFINWEEATATTTFPNGSQAVVQAPIESEGSAAHILFGLNWWFGGGE